MKVVKIKSVKFKLPKLKLKTDGTSKIGLIDIDGKEYTYEEIEKMRGIVVKGDLDLPSMGLTKLPKIKSIGGDFDCNSNKLTSLEGSPKSVGGDFYCTGNKKKFTRKDVKAVCKVKGKIFVN